MKSFFALVSAALVVPLALAAPSATTVAGFDISYSQGTVDFSSAASSGAKYVYIRVLFSLPPLNLSAGFLEIDR